MSHTDADARMENHFKKYYINLCYHVLKLINTNNRKVSVQHVMSSTRP